MRRSLAGSLAIRAALRIAQGYTGPASRAFRRAADDPIATQGALRQRLIAATARTAYGREHGLDADAGEAAFRRLPVVSWRDLAPWIDRERAEPGALVPARVVEWARSRGSTGPAKDVPYTAALKSSFARAVYVWAHDLLATGPRLRTGYCYFEIDGPDVRPRGLGSDDGYLDAPVSGALRPFLAVHPDVRRLATVDAFRLVLAMFLVACADLEVISIWDPDLLLEILDVVLTERDRILAALAARQVTFESQSFRLAKLSPERERALRAGDLTMLWPALQLVSTCAADTAGPGAAELARRLPHARHQPKGVFTTEAPLTIPLTEAGAAIPMITEVLFELEDDAGVIWALDEAAVGREYALVISQAGGLVRYRIGDRVRILDRWRRVPRLEYVGRG